MTSISSGDLDGCSSLLEYACICRSAAYQSSVAVSPLRPIGVSLREGRPLITSYVGKDVLLRK